MKKQFFTSALTLLITTLALGQQKVIQLYDGPAPGSESWNWTEAVSENNAWGTRLVYNVSIPTLTVYSPAPDKANGTAVVICPGGAFIALAIDKEGTNVAKRLVEKGVTCFVLKYRLNRSLTTDPTETKRDSIVRPLAIADGRSAILYVRRHAADFNIEPDRVGIMGFSAGGTVTAASLFNYSKENRPDFAAPIYPFFPSTMLGTVGNDAPPLFIVAASDDRLALHSVDLYSQWLTTKHDAELHMYAKGGHGFGMRVQNLPTDQWIDRFEEWLDVQGLLKGQRKR
ncbi:alpha/beta hydrolase [Seonamhaeicola maritimus]|uniref:alpha/beta hydrolase n=1 Tax=Seonamhaeicola maritimus TaxID=2591822 RepID=UPI002493F54B|nr:alpha/beta hydrolase [Seonamhaeicola maritimus]